MKELGRRMDFHTHSIFSDGALIPSELVRRAAALNYASVAIADHVDASNVDLVIPRLVKAADELNEQLEITVIPAAEITHVPPAAIAKLSRIGRKLGAKLILVHGETLAEPVFPGTNMTAVSCGDVDILAHPGLITEEEAELAGRNGVFLEITSRSEHCLTNGHIARVAAKAGAKLILNTDAHDSHDLITQEHAFNIALGAGLTEKEARIVVKDNAEDLLKKLNARSKE